MTAHTPRKGYEQEAAVTVTVHPNHMGPCRMMGAAFCYSLESDPHEKVTLMSSMWRRKS